MTRSYVNEQFYFNGIESFIDNIFFIVGWQKANCNNSKQNKYQIVIELGYQNQQEKKLLYEVDSMTWTKECD